MRTELYYFSGTGNSFVVAKDLTLALGNALMFSIPKIINNEIDVSADCLGIVYPDYMGGMPLIIDKFIKKIRNAKDKYIFTVITYGGMAGDPIGQLEKKLSQKEYELSAGFLVYMPGNYTPFYGAISKEKQKKLFSLEKQKINQIAQRVKQKQRHKDKPTFLIGQIYTSLVYGMGASYIPEMDKSFWVDENCNGCSVCSKICPVNNILIRDNKPLWQHRCQQCLSCLQWCPQEAIQFKKSTIGRKRYHHPEVKREDLM